MNGSSKWWLPGLALGFLACGGEAPHQAEPERGAPRPVVAVRVGDAAVGGYYRAAGTVRALQRAELGTRMMGRVESVRVRPGDRVRRGQVLATFDRAAQTAARRQATAGLELATSNLRRMERLHADSAIPVAQLEAARAGFAQAEAQAQAALAELSYAELVAPFAGVVTERLADPGDLAAPGRPLLVIEDDGAREIVVAAPERVAAQVRAGQTVEVDVGADARAVSARVVAVVPSADPMSRTVDIRLTTRERLASNLTAVANLPVAQEAAPLSVPPSAVVERGQLTGVYLFAPDTTLRLRWIRVGRRAADRIEVASGLVAGDLVARDAGSARDGEPAVPVFQEGAAR